MVIKNKNRIFLSFGIAVMLLSGCSSSLGNVNTNKVEDDSGSKDVKVSTKVKTGSKYYLKYISRDRIYYGSGQDVVEYRLGVKDGNRVVDMVLETTYSKRLPVELDIREHYITDKKDKPYLVVDDKGDIDLYIFPDWYTED